MGDLGHRELSQLHHPYIFISSAFQKLLFPVALCYFHLFLFRIVIAKLCNSKTLRFKCTAWECIKTRMPNHKGFEWDLIAHHWYISWYNLNAYL